MEDTSFDQETFALGWRAASGRFEVIGAVTLPARPATLGEARGGLRMIGCDERTTNWLREWAESASGERSLLLHLPRGWFELSAATIAPNPGAPGAKHDYVLRFDRRSLHAAPDA